MPLASFAIPLASFAIPLTSFCNSTCKFLQFHLQVSAIPLASVCNSTSTFAISTAITLAKVCKVDLHTCQVENGGTRPGQLASLAIFAIPLAYFCNSTCKFLHFHLQMSAMLLQLLQLHLQSQLQTCWRRCAPALG